MLQREVNDPRLGSVTVSAVEVARDLAHAKVYVSCLKGNDVAEIMEGLEHASGFLRSGLARRVKIRTMPQLRFIYDTSIDTGERISLLIDKAISADSHGSSSGEED